MEQVLFLYLLYSEEIMVNFFFFLQHICYD